MSRTRLLIFHAEMYLQKGRKAIEVVGPVEAVEVEAAKVHEGYWGLSSKSGAEYEKRNILMKK